MDQLLEMVMHKETVFFGLFLYGYYLQQKDKAEQRDLIRDQSKVITDQQKFIDSQQDVLKGIRDSINDIVKNQERLSDKLEKVESKFGGNLHG